jgi:aminoglycoside phosphotransferase (APT) family kinase protein
MSQGSRGRDPEQTARVLADWLAARLNAASLTVSDMTIPKAGFSNETLIGTASWIDQTNRDHTKRFVVRIEPTSHQLFRSPDALRQAAVMELLTGRVPVPTVWFTESDRTILGAPFFLMECIDGRVPPDVPCWHRSGWVKKLDPLQQTALHDNALRALIDLQLIPVGPEAAFLDHHLEPQTALGRHIAFLYDWYQWCDPQLIHGRADIDAAMHFLLTEQPTTESDVLVWGDARVGNMIFDDDFTVSALLDWEGAGIGPREIDIAWWVTMDEFLCEAAGIARLPGVPDRHGTYARYEELSGYTLKNIGFYEVLAGFTFSLINSRLCEILITNNIVDEASAAELVTRITDMTARRLREAQSL